jgi:hypothetical protein
LCFLKNYNLPGKKNTMPDTAPCQGFSPGNAEAHRFLRICAVFLATGNLVDSVMNSVRPNFGPDFG